MSKVKNLLEKAWELNEEKHQIFLDFQKAYGSIRRKHLYAISAEQETWKGRNIDCRGSQD